MGTYTISDGNGATDTATVNLTVNPENDDPVALTESIEASEDGAAVTGQLDASDVDGDTLSYSLVTDTNEGSITINTDGSYSYDVGSDFQDLEAGATRDVTFTYEVSDGQGGTVQQTGTVTVTGTNDGPVANVDTGSVDEDGSATFTSEQLLANDSDIDVGDSFSITAVGDASHGTVSLNEVTGEVTFTPDENYNGPASFTYTITDEHGATDTATVNLTVNPENDDPVALTESIEATEDGAAVTGQLDASDVDGDTLSYSLVTDTNEGSITINTDGTYSFDPGADFQNLKQGATREVSFTYEVSDGQGGTVQQTGTVTVTGTNDGPVANV